MEEVIGLIVGDGTEEIQGPKQGSVKARRGNMNVGPSGTECWRAWMITGKEGVRAVAGEGGGVGRRLFQERENKSLLAGIWRDSRGAQPVGNKERDGLGEGGKEAGSWGGSTGDAHSVCGSETPELCSSNVLQLCF